MSRSLSKNKHEKSTLIVMYSNVTQSDLIAIACDLIIVTHYINYYNYDLVKTLLQYIYREWQSLFFSFFFFCVTTSVHAAFIHVLSFEEERVHGYSCKIIILWKTIFTIHFPEKKKKSTFFKS